MIAQDDKLSALWKASEPQDVDAKASALWEATEPASWKKKATAISKWMRGTADTAVAAAGEGAGMALEAFGRAGEALTRQPQGEFPDATQLWLDSQPGGMRQEGIGLKAGSQAFHAADRAEFAEEYPKTAAVSGAIGSTGSVALTGLLTGPLAIPAMAATGSAMGFTAFRDDALAHGASPEGADLAGLVGAASGSLQAIPMAGPIARWFDRVPTTWKAHALRMLREAGTEAVQEGGDAFAQNLTAKYWVGYEKDRSILENVVASGAAGAASQLLFSLVGLGGGRSRSGQPDAEPDVPVESGPDPDESGVDPAASAGDPEGIRSESASSAPVHAPSPPVSAPSPLSPPAPTTPPVADPTAPSGEPDRDTAASTVEDGPGTSTEAPPEPAAAPQSNAEPADLSTLTGIKNAAVDAERAAMGLPPATHGERTTDEAQRAKAFERLQADPTAGQRLVAELEANPRAVSVEDNALLDMEAVRLKNERNAARTALEKAQAEGVGVDEALARVKAATDAYFKVGEIATVTGTGTAQALAFRRAMFKEDYSLAEMERGVREAKGGEALTPEESEQVKDLHDQIAKLTAEHEKVMARNRELEAKQAAEGLLPAIRARARRARATKPRGAIRERLAREADESRAALRGILSRAHTGLPVDALPHLAKIGADLIARGTAEFQVWSEAIVAEIGERARPHLQQVFDEAHKLIKQMRLDHLSERVTERMAGGKDVGRYVQQMAEHFVAEGITELDPLVDAVHAVLVKSDPNMTREQARDAISGYGQFRAMSKDEAKRKLADLKGQAQKLAQIEALEKRLAPLKTGFERVEPSPLQRKLQKRVNELRKQAGIKVEDPAKALKTALQSKETSLRNRIADLQQEIDTGQRSATTERPVPRNAATDALEAQLKALRAEHEAVFGKKGTSDEDRARAAIKATERAIADAERRVKEHDLTSTGPMQGPGTADVEALRRQRAALAARLEALRAELDLMRAVAQEPGQSAEEKRLQKLIENHGKPRQGPKQGPPTEEVAKLRAQLEALRPTPEQIALKAKKTRDRNATAELLEKIANEDFGPPPPKKPLQMDPEAIDLEAKRQAAQVEFKRLRKRHEYANRTTKQKVIDSLKELLNLPRAIWSSFDVSAPFRQGGILTVGQNPKRTARQIRAMFRALASADEARRIDAEIRARPGFAFGQASKLELTSLDADVGPQEEAIRSRLSDRIPGIPASNRAFITFLNIQRAEKFDALVRAIPGTPTPEQGRSLAHYVNVATGRGESKTIAKHAATASLVLWSPRLLVSRFQFLAGEPLAHAAPGTRKIIAEQYAKSLAGFAALLGLAVLAGGELEDDPRSSDFGKIRFGDSTLDPLAGLSQVTVLASRLASGESKSVKTGKVTDTKWQTVERFLRSKFTPVLGSAADLIDGTDATGEPVTLASEAWDAIRPLSFQEVGELMKAEGIEKGTALWIVSLFGMGLQTIEDRPTQAANAK